MVRFDKDRYTNLELIDNESNTIPCVFCLSTAVDEVVYNQLLITKEGTAAHFNCLIFSPGLKQADSDLVGIYGFTEEEIAKEIKRAKKLRCGYCHKSGATIGCCDLKCKVKFHYACGEAHGANYDFSGSQYKSFCRKHSAAPFSLATLNLDEAFCPICIEEFENRRVVIKSSCCTQAIFHKRCLQMSANQAGYFFRCPMCKDEKIFLDDVKRQGVYVPQQDAEWEYEPNAYQELLHRYQHCDAKPCRCPKGPNHCSVYGEWKVVRCNTCGAAGIHKYCGNLGRKASWCCHDCTKVVHKGIKDISGHNSLESFQQSSSSSNTPPPAIPGTSRGCLNSFFMQVQAGRTSTSKRHVVFSDEYVEGQRLSERASTSKSAQLEITNELPIVAGGSLVESTKSLPPNERKRGVTTRKHVTIANEPRSSGRSKFSEPSQQDKVMVAGSSKSTTQEFNSSKASTSKKPIRPEVVADVKVPKSVRKVKKVTGNKAKSSTSTSRKTGTAKISTGTSKQSVTRQNKNPEVQPVERTIYLAPECRDYFPHTRKQIKYFRDKTGIIPDWRMLCLGVQIVDLFSDPVSSDDEQQEALGTQAHQTAVKPEGTDGKKPIKDKKRKGQWKFGVIRRKYSQKKAETTKKRAKKTTKVENVAKAEEVVQPKRRTTRNSLLTFEDLTSDEIKETTSIQDSNIEEGQTLNNVTDSNILDLPNGTLKTDEKPNLT